MSLQLFEWVVLCIPPKLTALPEIPQIRVLNDIQNNVCIQKLLNLISMKPLKARSLSDQLCSFGCKTRKVMRNVLNIWVYIRIDSYISADCQNRVKV